MSVGGGNGTLLAEDDLLLRPSVFHSPFFFFTDFRSLVSLSFGFLF